MTCECSTWCRDGRPPITKHHPNCPKCNLAHESVKLVNDLIRGIEAWSEEEDGVHPELWEAYQRAVVFTGQIRKLKCA